MACPGGGETGSPMLMSSDHTGILSFTDRQAEAVWGSQPISEGGTLLQTHMLRGTFLALTCVGQKNFGFQAGRCERRGWVAPRRARTTISTFSEQGSLVRITHFGCACQRPEPWTLDAIYLRNLYMSTQLQFVIIDHTIRNSHVEKTDTPFERSMAARFPRQCWVATPAHSKFSVMRRLRC